MLQAGATGYLVKGSSVDQILEALHRAARGQSSLSLAVAPLVFEELQARLGREHRAQDAQRQRIARVRAVVEHRCFSMVFQPILDLATGRGVGFEALARFADEPIRPQTGGAPMPRWWG
jgi:sensor c-di-GMP phosphodiesterase-like protein